MYSSSEKVIGSLNGPMVRLAFAQGLFKARAAVPGAPEKFGASLIIKKSDTAIVSVLQGLVAECVEAEWGPKGLERFKKGLIKNPILDGALAVNKKTGEQHKGFGSDVWQIRPQANIDRPPAVRWKSPNIQATETDVYSGCYGKAVINAFCWTHPQSGDGVSFGILAFQRLSDEGERLGGGPADLSGMFDTLTDEGAAPAVTQGGAGASALFG